MSFLPKIFPNSFIVNILLITLAHFAYLLREYRSVKHAQQIILDVITARFHTITTGACAHRQEATQVSDY